MKIINRKYYIDKLIALKNKPDIKIITGVRRAGKSVLLNEFSKYILSVEKDANIITIVFIIAVFFLDHHHKSIHEDIMFSNTAMSVEIAAKSMNRKNTPPQNIPYSICENTDTKVTKISPGP